MNVELKEDMILECTHNGGFEKVWTTGKLYMIHYEGSETDRKLVICSDNGIIRRESYILKHIQQDENLKYRKAQFKVVEPVKNITTDEMKRRIEALEGSRKIILHLLKKKREELVKMEAQQNVLLKEYNTIEKEYAELKLAMIKGGK